MKSFYKFIVMMLILCGTISIGFSSDFKDDEIREEERRGKPVNLTTGIQPNQDDLFGPAEVIELKSQTFIRKGTVLNISDKDIDVIRSGNFVYDPFFRYTKTNQSNGQYVKVGAFILNTQDPESINHLW